MIVPGAVPFSSLPRGGVFTTDLVVYSIKVDDASAVNLADGTLNGSLVPALPVTYFPSAAVVLG